MSTLDMGPGEEYGLGGDEKRVLCAAFRNPAHHLWYKKQHRTHGPVLFDRGPAGGNEVLSGTVVRYVLERLIGLGLVIHEGAIVRLTDNGATVAAQLDIMGECSDIKPPESA